MFEPKVFIPIGNTGDDNNYPILHDKDGDEFNDRYKVGIPMQDYIDITKHFDSIDERLTEMEEMVVENEFDNKPSLIEWLYSNKGISDYLQNRNEFNAESNSTWLKDFSKNDVPEWGLSYRPDDAPHFNVIMSPEVKESNKRFGIFKANEMQQKYYNYGILIHEGNETNEDCGCFFPQDQTMDYLLGSLGSVGDIFTPMLKLPDTVDIKAVIGSDYLRLTTWIHSIVDGVHREQQFTVQKWIGLPPVAFKQPRSTVLVGDDPWVSSTLDEVIEYCNEIKDWKQREKDIEEYWIQRNKTIQQAHTEALVEIEACIENGKLYAREAFGTGYGQGEKLVKYDINPWAYWVSPEASVRPVFQSLLKPVNSGSGSVYRGM